MDNKKKFRGGLKVLLSLLFIMLLGQFSTCYASQPTVQEMTNFIDFLKYKMNNGEMSYSSKLEVDSQTLAERFLQATSNYDYTIDNLVFISSSYLYDWVTGSATNSKGLFCIVNNTFSNTYKFFTVIYPVILNGNQSYPWACRISFRESSEEVGDDPYARFNIDNNYNISSVGTLFFQKNNNFSLTKDGSLLNNNVFMTTYKTASFYYDYNSSGTFEPVLNNYTGISYYEMFPNEEPEEPSGDVTPGTGTITNPSGEITGQIDLSGIEQGITDIKDTISGEAQAIRDTISGESEKLISTITQVPSLSGESISSGDITSALNFEFETDRYANFWLELTNGLREAFTGTKRTIDITFQNRTWTINLDSFAVLPDWLKIILTPLSTVFFTWILVRWWKLIIDKISSGNVDTLLKENAEEGISNLF